MLEYKLVRGCRGLARAGAEEVRTLTQARFLR